MGATSAYHAATIGASSHSSLSIRSEDSHFEFGCCGSVSDDPPVSPRLHCSSPSWESSASSYTSPPSRSAAAHLLYFAAPTVHVIDGLQQVQARRVSCEDKSASINDCHSQDADDAANCRHDATADMRIDICSDASKTSRQTASSSSSVAASKSSPKDMIGSARQGFGQSTKADYCGYASIGPSSSPSRAQAAHQQQATAPSPAYGHSTLPSLPRKPMSPHAQHYQQQRARNQQLKRKTLLPYRQNFLSSCFFPSPEASC